MKIIDIIAILGALAWLPQIFAWIYHWLQNQKFKYSMKKKLRLDLLNLAMHLTYEYPFSKKNMRLLITLN